MSKIQWNPRELYHGTEIMNITIPVHSYFRTIIGYYYFEKDVIACSFSITFEILDG